jgi:D-serine deaminase-like pyridoxal phosphate-dependent protein
MIMASGAATLDQCAMTVLSTVVSRPTGDRAVLDVGSKALSSDSMGAEHGYGLITAYPLARIAKLSEEHGAVDLTGSNERPRIGERVRIVPNHACVVSNLFDRIYGIQGDEVVGEWSVAARGRMG